MKYLGIDGCKKGWFFVGINDDLSFQVGVIREFSLVRQWLDNSTLILVDIPIGLLTAGKTERLCDLAARQMIKPRGSTVFPAPARSAIYKETYEEASAENYRCLNRKLSKQSFEICKKIREVDEFMRDAQPGSKIREMHPEVAFCGLHNMSPILTRKKKPDGFQERIELLRALYPKTDAVVREAREQERFKKDLANDDILDALVGAVTALHHRNLETLPREPDIDDEGLPMEMVYALRSNG
ncbi:MAG: DUF429 domain-containing protein [Woeseia sp.]